MRPPNPPRTLTTELAAQQPGTTVTLRGHVHRRRTLSSVTFLIVRDRTGLAQVVIKDDDGEVPFAPEETPVQVTGIATPNPQAPGGVEVTSPRVQLLAAPAQTPPVDLWRPTLNASLPVLLDNAAVTWRHRSMQARWRIASASMQGFRDHLQGEGFTEVRSPKMVGTATESGANVFGVDYFGRQAYLAQSPQFYKQQLVGVFERVFEVGPVFRAEPHDTVRHLAEYTSLDTELGFITDHREVLEVLLATLRRMIATIEDQAGDAVELLEVDLPRLGEHVPVLHFARALELVGADPDEPDLAPEHERALGQWALAEHGSDFVAVEGYPLRKRPFYTHPWTGAPVPGGPWSNSFDLLFRGVELVTGGQRLHESAEYEAALLARGDDPAAYRDYLAAFAHGMPPHGGFAIGLERWVSRLVGAANVREVTLFPRDLHRLSP